MRRVLIGLAAGAVVVAGAVAAALAAANAVLSFPSDDHPCVPWTDALRPVLVGDTARPPTLGRMQMSDCVVAGRRPVADAAWRTRHPAVATVTRDGLVRGVAPGSFALEVLAEGQTRRVEGFVLPPGWRVEAGPDSLVVEVGGTVRLPVRAVTAAGGPLPPVPWWVDTPAHRAWRDALRAHRPGDSLPPVPADSAGLFDRPFDQSRDTVADARFVALRAGRSTLVARIGALADTVHVEVRSAPPR